MAKVSYSSLASTDLYENAEYIARDKPDAAYKWVDTIEGVCEMLAANPEMGQARKSRSHGPCRSSRAEIPSSFFAELLMGSK